MFFSVYETLVLNVGIKFSSTLVLNVDENLKMNINPGTKLKLKYNYAYTLEDLIKIGRPNRIQKIGELKLNPPSEYNRSERSEFHR